MTLLEPLSLPPVVAKRSRWRRALGHLGLLFWLAVALPTVVAAVYYGLVASDVYVSESRFVVRSPQRPAPSGIGALLAGTSLARSHDDTLAVHSYVRSRDALKEIDDKLQYRAAYADPHIDVLHRYPGIGGREAFDELYEHYLDYVILGYDTVSSISTLNVRAYTPEMAQAVNEQLLQMSERLVNNLNDRSRRDLIEVAAREVTSAELRAQAAAGKLSEFRRKSGMVDPVRETELQVDSIARLREELRLVETRVAQLRTLAPSNPQIAALNTQAERLKKAIETERGKVLAGPQSAVSSSPVYERLLLEKGFADRQLTTAMASLEQARNDASRKQLYLERLVQPNRPDIPAEPRRWRAVLTVLVVGLVGWGVISLLVAGVKEHLD